MNNEINKNCIGPCYPANTLFYNPVTMRAIKNNYTSCPIYPTNNLDLVSTKCSNNNIDENYKTYQLFDNSYKVANSPHMFLKQIYELHNFNEIEDFLKVLIFTKPLYTQKRILEAIFETYRTLNEFPTNNFINSMFNIKECFSKNITKEKLKKRILKVKNDYNVSDLFNYLEHKK